MSSHHTRSFMSFRIVDIRINFGLLLHLAYLKLILSHFLTEVIRDYVVHVQTILVDSLIFSIIGSTFTVYCICSLQILSFQASPIHLSIHISGGSHLVRMFFLSSPSLSSAGINIIGILSKFSFNLTGMRRWHSTPNALFHFIRPDFILWLTSSSVSPHLDQYLILSIEKLLPLWHIFTV